MKHAVDGGYWFLYRYSPKTGFTLDKGQVSEEYEKFLLRERRFSSLAEKNPERAKILFEKSKEQANVELAKLNKIENKNE